MNEFILCCVSHSALSQDFIEDLEDFLRLKTVLRKVVLRSDLHCREILVELPQGHAISKEELSLISHRYQTDIAVLPGGKQRDGIKLVVFDMDSTLIQQEVIDEMGMVFGIGAKVKAITDRAMNGELNFDQSLKERVALLKGLKRNALEEIYQRLKVTPGVKTFLKEAKKRGIKSAIVSGGFLVFAENIRRDLGMDYVFANQLEISGEELSGSVTGKIINAAEKAALVEELAKREGLSLDQVMAVGDGANDLLMLARAGLGVAFHAKEKVRREAKLQIAFGPMSVLLYYLGIPGNHFDETL